jgi:hypothetical protein
MGGPTRRSIVRTDRREAKHGLLMERPIVIDQYFLSELVHSSIASKSLGGRSISVSSTNTPLLIQQQHPIPSSTVTSLTRSHRLVRQAQSPRHIPFELPCNRQADLHNSQVLSSSKSQSFLSSFHSKPKTHVLTVASRLSPLDTQVM